MGISTRARDQATTIFLLLSVITMPAIQNMSAAGISTRDQMKREVRRPKGAVTDGNRGDHLTVSGTTPKAPAKFNLHKCTENWYNSLRNRDQEPARSPRSTWDHQIRFSNESC